MYLYTVGANEMECIEVVPSTIAGVEPSPNQALRLPPDSRKASPRFNLLSGCSAASNRLSFDRLELLVHSVEP
jgi:hypothetical protein